MFLWKIDLRINIFAGYFHDVFDLFQKQRLRMSKVICDSHRWDFVPNNFGLFHSRCYFGALCSINLKKSSLDMRGSRNFRQGGWVQVSLFCRRQMVSFKEIDHFSRFQRGSNFFPGGGGGVHIHSTLNGQNMKIHCPTLIKYSNCMIC